MPGIATCSPLVGYHPLMSLTDADAAAELASAGLHFVESMRGEARVPLPPNRSCASCLQEHGRFDSTPDEIVHIDAPDMPAQPAPSY